MYTREQASQIRQAFWTTFGQYISLHDSAEGTKVNWVNYKTGFKHIYFRMKADKKGGWVGIELTDPDVEIQELFYEQFLQNKLYLESVLGETWEWQLHTGDETGRTISTIGISISNVSVFKQDDWPALISFFKPRMIALDEFWTDAQYSFEALR